MEQNDVEANPIVLFDGVCNYCNTMVNFAIKWNKKRNLRFAPLQTDIGISLRNKFSVPINTDSVVFIEKNQAYIYSTAALKICKHLSFPAKLIYCFIIVPSIIREPIYKWVAANRYRWFGRKETCMIPTNEIKNLFLH